MQKKQNEKKSGNTTEKAAEKKVQAAPAITVDELTEEQVELDEELSAIESWETGAEGNQKVNETIEKLKQEKDEYLNLLKRERADFENYKKRNADIAAASYMNGVGDAINSILPVIDNLDRALAVDCADNALSEGVKMIQRQLLDTLASYGVEEVKALGLQFDPTCMNAVMQVAKEEDNESNSVAEVLQKGYLLRGKLLRCAMVKVVQ